MASKCVTAAFYRRYVDLFDKENGFEGLSEYCEKLNATVLNPCEDSGTDNKDSDTDNEDSDTDSEDSLDFEGFIPPYTDVVIELLKSLEESDDSELVLTDFEKKLLYDRDELPLNIYPAEDIFVPFEDSPESTEVKSLDLAMQNLSIKSKKALERLNQNCPICEDNCYKHVVLVARELDVSESLSVV